MVGATTCAASSVVLPRQHGEGGGVTCALGAVAKSVLNSPARARRRRPAAAAPAPRGGPRRPAPGWRRPTRPSSAPGPNSASAASEKSPMSSGPASPTSAPAATSRSSPLRGELVGGEGGGGGQVSAQRLPEQRPPGGSIPAARAVATPPARARMHVVDRGREEPLTRGADDHRHATTPRSARSPPAAASALGFRPTPAAAEDHDDHGRRGRPLRQSGNARARAVLVGDRAALGVVTASRRPRPRHRCQVPPRRHPAVRGQRSHEHATATGVVAPAAPPPFRRRR